MIQRSTRAACVIGGLLLVGAGPTPLPRCPGTIRFTGAGGTTQWDLVANWDLGRLPNSTDEVCLPAASTVDLSSGTHTVGTLFTEAGSTLAIQKGTLSVISAELYGAFVLSGGSLASGGVVAAHGPFSWRGGTMVGPGTTVTDALTIEGDAVKSLTGSRTLDPRGPTVWTGAGALALQGGSKVDGSGSWDAQSDAPLTELPGGLGTASFNVTSNDAVFRKSAGSATKTLGVQFTNVGTTEVEEGTLQLSKGGQLSGRVLGAPGTTLRVSAGSYTAGVLVLDTLVTEGGTITAAGPSTLSEVSVTSGTANLGSGGTVSHLVLSGGMLAGNVTVTGPLEWTGGNLSGAGTTRAMGDTTISGTASKAIAPQRVLETYGTTVCNSTLQLLVGSTLRNMGIFHLAGGGTFSVGATSRFENAAGAIFRKSSATNLPLPGYVNDGTIVLEADSIGFLGGGTGSGSVVGSPGSRLSLLASVAHLWGPGSSITGVELTVASPVSLAGVVSLPKTRVQLSAALDLTSTTSTAALGELTLSSGTLRVEHEAEATSSTLSGGTIAGPGRLRILGDTGWTGGTMTEGGTTETLGPLSLSGSGTKDLTGGRLLLTGGSTAWTGTGSLRMGGGARVRNTGSWDLLEDVLLDDLGGGASIENTTGAVFRKTGGSGTAELRAGFTNAGEVRVASGRLRFQDGFTQSAPGTLAVEIADDLHDRVDVGGAALLDGTLDVTLRDGLEPQQGDTFTILTAPEVTGSFFTQNLPPLPQGIGWLVHVGPTSVELEVAVDQDGDGRADAGDCAPSDPTVREVPAEVRGAAFGQDKQTLSWTSLAASAGSSTVYDALRGRTSELPVGGVSESCVLFADAALQLIDAAIPDPGDAFYYLVRARNVCGVGSYGTASGGFSRITPTCP